MAKATPNKKLLDPEVHPVLTAKQGMEVYGLSKVPFYAAVRRGDIPSIRIGGRIVIPTAAVRRQLGLDVDQESAAS